VSQGPQVVDMECQEIDGQIIDLEGPSFSFEAIYTSSTTTTFTTLAWSHKEMGLASRGNESGYHGKCHSNI
jgi:hypothetical protein